METLLARTRAWLEGAGLAQGPHRAALAVSGGLDSAVLMHLLARLAPELGWALAILHVDHALRPTSAHDAALVAALAERAALPFAGGRTPVRPRRGESLEMAARRVRYAFLEDAASRLDCDLIATAHHADDVAETVLMRLARGSGAGALGIPPRNGRLIRPLLHATRAELAGYARQHRLVYLTDPSNADRAIPRNRVRHEWLPLMTATEPGVVRGLNRTAALARMDD
ncbi:MAG TPA: tRNA lysidine(34) synthetase TilS, partial [Limnochordia bacterium]|nr:tRNA lysidine(34) synthetase TilS [Limnochordia bacterium]